jgi:hypothetical protein
MKSRKVKVTLALFIVLVCTAAVPLVVWAANIGPNYAWYTDNPSASEFTLNNRGDFAGFANLVNGTADVDNDGTAESALDFSGKTVRLADGFSGFILNNSVDPIGGQGNTAFNGTFDGNGNTLNSISVDTKGITKNLGVFGHTGPDSVIKNLSIGSTASLTKILSDTDLVTIENVGLLVGYCEGRIENCVNNGSVTIKHEMNQTATFVYPIRNVGGLAGKVLGDVVSCGNNGKVSVTETGYPYKVADGETWADTTVLVLNVGGVAGCLGIEDSKVSGNSDIIHGYAVGCENTGTIEIDTPNENGFDRFGNQLFANSGNIAGVFGYSRGSVTNSQNSSYVNAPNGIAVGGIVGGLRNSSESSNMSGSGKDDGTSEDPISISECVNSGNIQGRAVVGGIIGRAGTYTTIQACINEEDTNVVATRPNKPFPAGIVGVTYGNVSYCANFGTVASGEFNGIEITITKAGYYAAGIAGGTHYWTNEAGTRISPLPEVYGCYNAGWILANGNYRQRHIVGNNEGYCHDNIAVEGFVPDAGDKIVYGDEPGDSDATGVASGNYLVTGVIFKSNAVIDSATQATSLSVLNTSGDKDGWLYYWALSTDGLNDGYPALNTQAVGNTDISSATVSLASDAQYTGLASVPKAKVTFDGVTLIQGIDFKVIPEDNATEVTATGATPYTAHIVAIGGTYTGTATQTLAYGIKAGNLSDCTVLIDPKPFNWEAQEPTAGDIHAYNLAGGEINSGEYTFALDQNDSDLSTLENGSKGAVNAKKYDVVVTAKEDSEHFVGSVIGEFTISPVKIIWNSDDVDDSKNAHPLEINYGGQTYDWQSSTITPNTDDDDFALKAEYTGYPIYPEVTKVTYLGRELVRGDISHGDYYVIYSTTMEGASVDNTGEVGGKGYGTITATYVPGGNFSNQDNMKFIIVDTPAKNDIANAQIKGDADIIFEPGSVYEPIQVWFGGSKLNKGVDYQIAYADNDKLGTASYTITGIGNNFEGTVIGTFDIVDGVTYTLNYSYDDSAKTASLIGGNYLGMNETFEIEIPETVVKDGTTYTVTSIAQNAFGNSVSNNIEASAAKISKVTIPSTVKSIGANAFGTSSLETYFTNLTSVIFAEDSQLETIGESAFRGVGISEIVIPANVSTIGNRAFQDCVNLERVTFLSSRGNKPNASSFSTSPTTTPFAGDIGVAAYGYEEATGISSFVKTYYSPGNPLNLAWTWTSLGNAPITGPTTGLPGSGDYNGDGLVTGVDSTIILRVVAGLLTITPAQRDALDIDRDGILTGVDSTYILRKAAGLSILGS